jgi:hypothetical protein
VPALGVVVFDVSGDCRASGGEIFKVFLPGAFLFESANEPLAQAVLLGRVGVSVLPRCARPRGILRLVISASLRILCEAIIAHVGAVGFGAKHEAVVISQREATWSTEGGAEVVQQGVFQGSFCVLVPGSVC